MTTTDSPTYRRKGKIASLTKELRDFVNQQLDDGATYAVIAEELQKRGVSVNAENLSNWKQGGYQDYCRNRDWNDRLLERQERFLDATGNDPVKLADAGMQIAVTGLCELLDELSRIETKDENSSDRYARLTNAMTRLARVILISADRRDTLAKEKAAELPKRDPNKPFGDESDHRAVVDIIDRVLGLGKYHRHRNPQPTLSDQSIEAPAVSESVNVSESPCASVSERGAPSQSEVQISNQSSKENPDASELPTGVPQPPSATTTENTQQSTSAPTTTNTIEWVPLDQRPWNWADFPEYASMPSFPPTQ